MTFAIFFLIVMPIAWQLRDHPARWKVFVLAASYVFYSWWDWRFLGLIVLSSVGNWFFGRAIARAVDDAGRRRALVGGLVLDLGMLGFFKYYGFFVETLVSVLRPLGLAPTALLIEITLPVAISFYTFCAISYLVDIYRGQLEPSPLLDVSVFLAFFPHLVAGPIVRGSEMLPQIASLSQPDAVDATRALRLISRGLVKKVVVASYLAQTITDPVFGAPRSYRTWDLIAATYAFSVQIYADFSGYTDIAIGCALLLGIKFPQNFDRPYAAVSLQDFWRRWHMTLSRWLRDYLYIPLGGGRGPRWQQYRNLFLTMFLGGLWHGASWNFAIWGTLHGGGLAVERWRRDRRASPHPVRAAPLERLRTGLGLETSHGEVPVVGPDGTVALRDVSDLEPTAPHSPNPWIGRLVTFHVVTFAWIFFKAGSLADAWAVIAGIFTRWGASGVVTPLVVLLIVAALAAQFVPPRVGNLFEWRVSRTPPVVQALGFTLVLLACNFLGPEGVAPFIYFQF
jgi:D-alanyl-lipoteichoic acid acyltransferase DltB (MBOAT superfamily)